MSGLSADQRTTVLNIPPEILAYIFELGTESGLSESIEDTDDRRPSGEFLDDEVKREVRICECLCGSELLTQGRAEEASKGGRAKKESMYQIC